MGTIITTYLAQIFKEKVKGLILLSAISPKYGLSYPKLQRT